MMQTATSQCSSGRHDAAHPPSVQKVHAAVKEARRETLGILVV